MRGQVLLCMGALPGRALQKGNVAAGRRRLCAKSLHTSLGATISLQVHQEARNPPALPRFAMTLVGSQHHGWDLFLSVHTAKNQGGNPGLGSQGCQDGGVWHCTWWAPRIQGCVVGIPWGPQKLHHEIQKKRGCMGTATWGDAKPAPTCETFQEAKTGCPKHAPGQIKILLCLFPLHFYCLAAMGWSILAGATLALHEHGTKQAEPHYSCIHRHYRRNPCGGMGTCQCRAPEGVGVETPLYHHRASWQFSPSLFPAPGWCLSSAPGRAGLDSSQAGWRHEHISNFLMFQLFVSIWHQNSSWCFPGPQQLGTGETSCTLNEPH